MKLVKLFKDLGVIHCPDMKNHQQVGVAVAKARSAAYLIRRVFRQLCPEVFLSAYTALVRPVLEYSIHASALTTVGDMVTIENDLSMATRSVSALRLVGWWRSFCTQREVYTRL